MLCLVPERVLESQYVENLKVILVRKTKSLGYFLGVGDSFWAVRITAQNNLGVCYYNGQGVSKNYEQAVYWFRKAAEQGNAVAQNNLGECYRDGDGVEKDLDMAKYWFRKSMAQGNDNARKNLERLNK